MEKEIIGWTGVGFLLTAYTLNSLGYIETTSYLYPLLNLIAAIFLGLRVWFDRNWSNLFLEFFWGGIALYSLYQLFEKGNLF